MVTKGKPGFTSPPLKCAIAHSLEEHITKGPELLQGLCLGVGSLAVSYSRMANATLPSALQRFTSVFGMRTGGSTALLPPGKIFIDLSGTIRNSRRLARQGEVQDEPNNLGIADSFLPLQAPKTSWVLYG